MADLTVYGTLKFGLSSHKDSLTDASAYVVSALNGGSIKIFKASVLVAEGALTGFAGPNLGYQIPNTPINATAAINVADANLVCRICTPGDTGWLEGPIDGSVFVLSKDVASGTQFSIQVNAFPIDAVDDRELGEQGGTGGGVGQTGIDEPAPPPAGVYSRITPSSTVTDWYIDTTVNPTYWPSYALGLHDSSGDGNDPSTGRRPDWPVPWAYTATRSHDRSDSRLVAALQWARLNPADGVHDWTGLDEWIDDNLNRFKVFVLFGTPIHAQIYPGESWGYGYISGGASPAIPGKIKQFQDAMFAHLRSKYGSNVIDVFEFWNEPYVRFQDSNPATDRQSPAFGYQKFWRGHSNQYTDNAIESGENVPSDVLFALGAWEGQDGNNSNHVFAKCAARLLQLGKMALVKVWSFHSYVYNGASDWSKSPREARNYIARFQSLGFPQPVLIINSEQGAEYSDGTGANGSSRLVDYTSQQRGEWLMRTFISQVSLGVKGVYFYNYRADDNELPPNDTNVQTAFNYLNSTSDCWIYQCGQTVDNRLFVGYRKGNQNFSVII